MGDGRQSIEPGQGARDYALVRRALPVLLSDEGAGGADFGDVAHELGLRPADLQRVLERWSGRPFEVLMRAWTDDRVRRPRVGSLDVLGARAGERRVHAFNVRIAATVTDVAGRRGEGLEIAYGFHDSPFGAALVMRTPDGVCGLAFADDEAGRPAALADMMGRWPRAFFREAPHETGSVAAQIFAATGGASREEVPLMPIGTPFDLAVWQTLLRIPMGRTVSYTDIARALGRPEASRAVGTANGRNPISFVVPCHRALRSDGALGGYYWGLDRKRALIAWETI